MRGVVPFRLLEIKVISAQDLARVSRSMETYAVAWVRPNRKLTTRVDRDGRSSPSWNEKFVFRVDDEFLESEASTIVVEIYNVAWLKKDTCVGHVSILVSNILPADVMNRKSSDTYYVTLQVRRPSGRPQGILNLGVSLLDNTLRSMPLYTEPDPDPKPDPSPKKTSKPRLRRTNSDVTDLTTDPQKKASSIVNPGPANDGGSMVNRNGSMVNGSVIGAPKIKGGSIISDIGPSASIVAAAISRGIYPIHLGPNNRQNDGGSLILENIKEKDEGAEGLKMKIDRWKNDVPAVYDHKKEMRKTKHKRRRTTGSSNNSLFSCFGNSYGIEISIKCGGNRAKKSLGSDKSFKSKQLEDSFSDSYI